jgi:hypothetical protein
MFSHSSRDLSAIRFQSVDALILTTLGVTVCPILHTLQLLRRAAVYAQSNAQVSDRVGRNAIKRILLREHDRMQEMLIDIQACAMVR